MAVLSFLSVDRTGTYRPSPYLTRMLLFLAAVAIVVALLHRGLVDAFMTNPVLNVLILLLTAAGILTSFRAVVSLRPDIAWLSHLKSRSRAGYAPQDARDDELLAGSPGALPAPRLLTPVVHLLGEGRSRVAALTPPAMRSLLDGVGARLTESREISRYLIGLLVFLGLLGTFWGLIRTIHGVADVIGGLSVDATDMPGMFNEIKGGLAEPLAGMGTAFGSSLFGLAGSLVLGFLELQAGQAQNRFYNELEDWLAAATRLGGPVGTSDGEPAVPAYVMALLEQTAENLDRLQQAVAAAEDNRRQASAGVTLLAEKLATLTDQMRAEQGMLARLADTQTELRTALIRLVETAGQGAFGLDDASRGHVRDTATYLRRLLEELPVTRDQTVAEVRNEIKMLARTLAALAETETV